MALHFALRVNGQVIGTFYAQRREPVVPADGVYTYDVTVSVPAGPFNLGDQVRTAVVKHRFADGAFALVLRALEALWPSHAAEPAPDTKQRPIASLPFSDAAPRATGSAPDAAP